MQMNVTKIPACGVRIGSLAAAAACAVMLAGCNQHDAQAIQPDTAASAAAHVAKQATQQLDQVASFVNQQVSVAKAGVA